ncbi:hypothetical protein [Bacillus sp. JJ1562]|uniref:hypothetical protein n=1 Tax=Bacillus sp. JJ1562 TaxID=3122960 RepID=UPI0030031EC5
MSEKGEEWLRELIMKNQDNIYRHEKSTENRRTCKLEFEEYLTQKHILKNGEKELKPISIKQYMNRLESMRRHGIYNEELQMDSTLEAKIRGRYRDWKTYVKTVEHYLSSKNY